MFYVIEVGYQRVLIDSPFVIDPENVFPVSTRSIDGIMKFIVEESPDVNVYAVPKRKVVFPGTHEEQETFRKLYDEMERDRDEYRSRAWKAEEKLKEKEKEQKANE